jgi:hypothetical protein
MKKAAQSMRSGSRRNLLLFDDTSFSTSSKNISISIQRKSHSPDHPSVMIPSCTHNYNNSNNNNNNNNNNSHDELEISETITAPSTLSHNTIPTNQIHNHNNDRIHPTLSEDVVEQFEDALMDQIPPILKQSNSSRKLETVDVTKVEEIDAEEESVQKVKVYEEEKGEIVVIKQEIKEDVNKEENGFSILNRSNRDVYSLSRSLSQQEKDHLPREDDHHTNMDQEDNDIPGYRVHHRRDRSSASWLRKSVELGSTFLVDSLTKFLQEPTEFQQQIVEVYNPNQQSSHQSILQHHFPDPQQDSRLYHQPSNHQSSNSSLARTENVNHVSVEGDLMKTYSYNLPRSNQIAPTDLLLTDDVHMDYRSHSIPQQQHHHPHHHHHHTNHHVHRKRLSDIYELSSSFIVEEESQPNVSQTNQHQNNQFHHHGSNECPDSLS